jgi:hypothetical protein
MAVRCATIEPPLPLSLKGQMIPELQYKQEPECTATYLAIVRCLGEINSEKLGQV